jgi:hypothetical protein
MDFRETLSTLLPPPRNGEPPSLRQDILDELCDHLACAYKRELLRGADSSAARQRVLERFGDPAVVARRLWLDAMKGKIMAQRVLIATCLVFMLACVSVVALAWHWMNQDRLQRSWAAAQALEANRRMAEALAQAQATNKDMLNKMSEMSEALRHPRSPDWNPVTFKLTEKTPDGPPVAGFSVYLSSDDSSKGGISRTSDASGIADFGAVHPGDYTFTLSKNWGKGAYQTSGQINIRPGSELHKPILCPMAPPERADVRIRVAWPADLKTEGLIVYAPFTFTECTIEPGLSWHLSDFWTLELPQNLRQSQGIAPPEPQPVTVTRSVLCGSGGGTTEIVNLAGLHLWKASKPKRVYGDIRERDLRELPPGAEVVKWEPGTYRLPELMVVRPDRGEDVEKGRRRYEVLAKISSAGYGHAQDEGQPPHAGIIGMIYPWIAGPPHRLQRDSLLPVSDEYWLKTVNHFEARPGRVNEWTIPLPDELITAVRAALKVDHAAKTKTGASAVKGTR